MSTSVEDSVQDILRTLDNTGRGFTVPDWVEFLERMVSECRERLDAAREDLRR